jgi:putative transposase
MGRLLTIGIDFVLSAVDNALLQAVPEIWNSDQREVTLQAPVYRASKNAGVRISMDGRGQARDSIFIERLP